MNRFGTGRGVTVLAAVVVAVSVLVGCSSSGDLGDRARDAVDRAGEVSGLSDEFDETRDAVRDRIDEERDVLEGRARDTPDNAATIDADLERFCARAADHEVELADGIGVPDDRRVEIYEDLRAVAPERIAQRLDTAIDAARTNRTAPERVDAQRAADDIVDLVTRSCH